MRFSIAPCSIISLALASCIGGGSDGDSGFSLDGHFDVLSIDRDAGTITTRAAVNVCVGGESVAETDTTTDRYVIEDGKLLLWDEEECTAQILEGSSSDIVGTWKGSGLDSELPIPAGYRPPHCPDTVEVDSTTLPFAENLSVTYQVTETRISFKASGDICMMDVVTGVMMEDGFTVESSSCNYAVLKAPDGERAEVTLSFSGRTMTAGFSAMGKSCALISELTMPGHTLDCAKQQARQEAFMSCMEEMGGSPQAKALGKAAGALLP